MTLLGTTYWIKGDFPGLRPHWLGAGCLLAVLAMLSASLVPNQARAAECGGSGPGGGGGGSGGAGTGALFGEISSTLTAEPLSVELTEQTIGGSCLSVYVVKVLTASGAVAVLSYDAESLDLVEVEGPEDDETVAELREQVQSDDDKIGLAGDDSAGEASNPGSGADTSGSDSGDSGGGDSGGGDSGGGDSGGGDSGGGDSGGGDSGGGDSGGGDSGGGDSSGGDSSGDD